MLVVLALLCTCALAATNFKTNMVGRFSGFRDDNFTINFPLIDVYDDEMATYVRARIGNDEAEKILVVDISSYMTIIYETEPVNATTHITYRSGPMDAYINNDFITIKGYKGAYDNKNPEYQDFTVMIDIAHVNLNTNRKLAHDGVLGLASITNQGASSFSFLQKLVQERVIKAESYRFNEVYLNSSAEQYQSSITLGFTRLPSDSDYLLTNNSIPALSQSDFSNKHAYLPILMKVGLKEVDILNYFDVSDFEKNETVILDTAVPYIQLPESTLAYFDRTFFSDNCFTTSQFDEASCGCVGSDYGGLPSIDFRFRDYLRYTLEPRDYMSPPLINTTTREPFCRLGIFAYWSDHFPKNTGLGKIFINKYSLFVSVDRQKDEMVVGFVRGKSYKSWGLIFPTIVYYFFVITILSSLAIWLSIKKYKRLEEEKKKRRPLLQPNKQIDGLKNVSKTLRKMDFNMNMSAYNKVFERQRANTLTH